MSYLLFSPLVHAIVPPEYSNGHNPLASEIEFGFIFAKSNTTTNTINSRLKFDYNMKVGTNNKNLQQVLTIRHYFSEDDISVTTQKLQSEYQVNYELGAQSSFFGRVSIEHDKFASFIDTQTVSSGYSLKVYDFIKSKLTFELGPGYRYNKPNSRITNQKNLESTSEPIIRGAVIASKRLNQNLKISGDAATELGIINTISSINSRLENYLLGNLALTFEIRYTYTKQVPEGSANSEFFSNLNLMYSF